MRPDDVVSAGDVIQAMYRTQGKYMVILSLDGNRHVTIHYPEQEPCSTEVPDRGRFTPLGSAFELDDAPLFEHFFLITAESPISIKALTLWFQETPYTELSQTALPDAARIASDFRLKKR